jgi:tRNA threonylcarbamoyladenosine biosynthesis protein TsaB
MYVLAADTATPVPALALSSGSAEAEIRLPLGRQTSEVFLSVLEQLLATAGIDLSGVVRLAVCAGPGSFTGIRVGLSTCWGFARSLGIPLEAAGSLEAVAESARGRGPSKVLCAFGADRGELYVARYDLSDPRAREITPPLCLPAGEIAAAAQPGDLVIRLEEEGDSLPSPALGLARAVARRPGPDAGSLHARYVRLSAADERRV